MGRHGCGRELAVGPNGAVFEVLFFPDGNGALEGVNGVAASVKGGAAVRCTNGDKDAGFADFEASKPVDDGDAMDCKFFVEVSANLAHLVERHGLVRFIVEIKRGAIVRLIADEAVEGDNSAVRGCADVANQRSGIDSIADELKDVVIEIGRHCVDSAAAHGRKKGNFVAGMERGIPVGEFLIERGDDGRAVFGEYGMARGVQCEELFERGEFGNFGGVLRQADDVLQAPEKEHLDADSSGDGGHGGIVTRVQRQG